MENFGRKYSNFPRSLSNDYQHCLESNQGCNTCRPTFPLEPPGCNFCVPLPSNDCCSPCLDDKPCLRPWNFQAVMDCMFCKLGPDLIDFAEAFCKTTEMGNCNSFAEKSFSRWTEKMDTVVSYKSTDASKNITYETTVYGK